LQRPNEPYGRHKKICGREQAMKIVKIAAGIVVLMLAQGAAAREQIFIVGSSTVFPFAATVAEEFGKGGKFKTPIVESTGTGGGLKLFCAGVGEAHPDIANASRKITESELKDCAANGVTDITEIKIGFDGIIIANSVEMPPLAITLDKLYLALAKEVPSGAEGTAFKAVATTYQKWSDVDPKLPGYKIVVYGPPPTSGTRDAFVEQVMEPGCLSFAPIKTLRRSGEEGAKTADLICGTMREDGGYIDSGENDNLIVQKLEAYPAAFGIFGYSFLHENTDKLQGAIINGVAPTFDSIAAGSYPISRPLYLYVKNAHAKTIPGVREYLAEFTSEEAFGPVGYLTAKGLVPLTPEERVRSRATADSLTPLTN
jgi:phosphate transport system substrate-binding protein